jgi:hypothetical protein
MNLLFPTPQKTSVLISIYSHGISDLCQMKALNWLFGWQDFGKMRIPSSFLRITPLCNISTGNKWTQSGDRFVFHTETLYLDPILATYPRVLKLEIPALP